MEVSCREAALKSTPIIISGAVSRFLPRTVFWARCRYTDFSRAPSPHPNLVEHLSRWAAVIGEHGLVTLEVHCLDPRVTAEFLDMCAGLYFDTCQSMSHQWLVEPSVWLTAAAEAGLFPRKLSLTMFPKRMPYKRMTLARFVKRPFTIRTAASTDMDELVEMESVSDQTCREQTTARMENSSRQFVLVMNRSIVGAVYTQRIESTARLDDTTSSKERDISNQTGNTLQIVAITVASAADTKISPQDVIEALREFVIGYAASLGIAEIAMVVTAQEVDEMGLLETGGRVVRQLPNWFVGRDALSRHHGVCVVYSSGILPELQVSVVYVHTWHSSTGPSYPSNR